MGWKYEAGQKFNQMTLVAKLREEGAGAWSCRCDCGNEKVIKQVYDVRRGRVQSCGCVMGMHGGNSTATHAATDTPLYRIWLRMRSKAVHAGQGMVDHWSTFSGFHEDMGGSYREGKTLRLIDSAQPFSPSNCQWSDRIGRQYLTPDEVRYVRRAGDELFVSTSSLARELSVSEDVVSLIIAGKTYGQVV